MKIIGMGRWVECYILLLEKNRTLPSIIKTFFGLLRLTQKYCNTLPHTSQNIALCMTESTINNQKSKLKPKYINGIIMFTIATNVHIRIGIRHLSNII